jgi:pimeloyl-ACP methyl ester carboxylesterase
MAEPVVSHFTRVLAYDRANLGKSHDRSHPRTSTQIVDELRNLLITEDIEGPYVLVGHSFGGLNMLVFASRFPQEVVGLVLVDSVHPDLETRFQSMLSPEQQQKYNKARNDEGISLEEKMESGKQVKAALALPDVPLVVIVRGNSPYQRNGFPGEFEQSWVEMQEELSQLTTKGKLVKAPNSGHYIQRDEPGLVIEAIREVVEKVRNGG